MHHRDTCDTGPHCISLVYACPGIVGRADVLCACLSLAAFALLGASSSSWLALVAALTVVSVAFFCKETAITMLGVFVVHEALRATSTTTGRKRWAIAARMLAIVCTGVALLSVRLVSFRVVGSYPTAAMLTHTNCGAPAAHAERQQRGTRRLCLGRLSQD